MKRVFCPAISIALIAAVPMQIYAQEAESEQLETISVTATREEQKTVDLPVSIGVVSKQEIALDKPNYQKELLNSIAGVRITQTGSSLGHMTGIRMPLNTGPYYLFLQDGIPVQSSGFFNHNGLAYTNFSSAASAEVMKGAGTALYGSDAVAATINVISNDPSLSNDHILKANAGSDGFYKLGVSGGHQINEKSSIGVEASYSDNDGWRDHTASQRGEFNLTHFLEVDDKNSLKTIVSMNSTEAEMAGSLIGLDALENETSSVGDIEAALDSGLDIVRKFDFARVSTEWTHYLNDETELSTIGYLRSNRNQYTATWQNNLPHNDSEQQTAGLMFKANINKEKVRWILGTDVEMTQSNLDYQQLFDYTPSGWGSSVPAGSIYDYDVDYLSLSPYVRVEQDLSEKLLLSAGLRYDASEFDYTNNLEDGQYADSSYSRPSSDYDPSFSHLSPKLSLSYRISNNQNVYARYANGFRIPQATRLYSLNTKNIDFELDPETSDTFEIGYKVAHGRDQFEVSVYYMSIDDSIVRRENEVGDQYYVNGGETTHQGIEVSWFKPVNPSIATRIAYSYSLHEFVDDPEYNDNEQAQAPNSVANLRLIYTPQSVQSLSAMFEVEYVSDYWMDDSNTTSYEGFVVAHLKANYDLNTKLKLTGKINNITDEIYAENASYSYGKEKYTPAAPRQFFVGLEYLL